MEEKKPQTTEEETAAPKKKQREKSAWQQTKEGWYDKVPLNVKQLDIIIIVAWILLALTIVFIALDVTDVYHLFG